MINEEHGQDLGIDVQVIAEVFPIARVRLSCWFFAAAATATAACWAPFRDVLEAGRWAVMPLHPAASLENLETPKSISKMVRPMRNIWRRKRTGRKRDESLE